MLALWRCLHLEGVPNESKKGITLYHNVTLPCQIFFVILRTSLNKIYNGKVISVFKAVPLFTIDTKAEISYI